MRAAAIDVGTNTVRLLVADVEGNDLVTVDKGREITRLGQGVDAGRRLHPDAIARTRDAIERFVRRARDAGAERIRIAGTSVLRDAADRDEFAQDVEARTGVRLEVIAGEEEGRLSYLGATFELSLGELDPGKYVVCDIGGGSTELSTPDASVSIDVGSVRVKERFLGGDPPSPDEISSARAFVRAELEAGAAAVAIGDDERLVGVAGTITTLCAVILGLPSYDARRVHRSVISNEEVAKWSERLLGMSSEEIRGLGPVEAGRADVIGAGSLVLVSVIRRWGFDHVLVSERDILDGLVLDLVR